MERKPFTLRLDEPLYKALSLLSEVVHRSMNDIITEAVSKHVKAQSETVALDMEETLAKLRAYRMDDPHFEDGWSVFAEAEAAHADPLEDALVIEEGSVQGKLRTLLSNA